MGHFRKENRRRQNAVFARLSAALREEANIGGDEWTTGRLRAEIYGDRFEEKWSERR